MGKKLIPTRESEILKFGQKMQAAIAAKPSSYGLTATEATNLLSQVDKWSVDYGVAIAAEAAKTSATATKNVTKKSLVTMVQLLNKKVQANPSVTDALKLDAGFSVPDTSPTAVIAVGVATLNVNGYETGENKLKWSRSGNAASVKFAVFASHDSGANWSQIAAITKTRFTHTGQTPGDAVWYKVVAYSANNTAPASPISVAYPEGPSNSLTLAA